MMSEIEFPNYKDVPLAGNIYKPGDPQYKTGDWRVFKPVIDHEKCTKCLLCWIFCPEPSIDKTKDGVEINYDQCKGCGLCAAECPVKCIKMVEG
jgi:pyruvate ferredoxin oxidoreductase delta subunit